MEKKWILHLVSHTHWDREWYYSFQRYRHRFVKLMDRLLDLLARDPRFRHFTLDGQTLPLRDYLEIRPEREPELREAIANGRLLIGPWFTQPNEFMSSGEAMIRNLILGFREAEDFGGVMRVCYLPDAFGHISQLPQLMRGFGIEDIVAWRGMPGGTKLVSDWVGADGTRSTFFYLYHGYGNALGLPLSDERRIEYIDGTPFEAQGFAERFSAMAADLEPRATTPHLLLMNGVDHSFAQADLPEIIDKVNRTRPDMRAEHSTLPHYIREVKAHHARQRLPYQQLSGELHDSRESPVLVDSQSTRAPVKIANDRIERLFEKWMEPFAAFAWMMGCTYPRGEIRQAWKHLLENQAHDSLACASADATYHQVMTRFEWAEELGEEVVAESLQEIANQLGNQTLAVFNPLSWARGGVVETTLDIPEALALGVPRLFDGERAVPLSILRVADDTAIHFNPRRGHPNAVPIRRYAISFVAQGVPGCGCKAYRLAGAARQDALTGGVRAGPTLLENEHLRLRVRRDGCLDLTDKRSGREFRSLHVFEDGGEAGHGFHHDAPQQDRIFSSAGAAARISLVERTPWTAAIRIETTLVLPESLTESGTARAERSVPCTISSTLRLSAGSPRIDIETTIENNARDHRLRITFPSGIQTDVSHAAQPFDVVARPIRLPDLNGYPDEQQSPVNPMGGFVDVSDGTVGLMIANQGMYEYEVSDSEDRRICVTLLRCTDKVYSGDFAASSDMRLPEAQCLGTTTFRYSIIPHQGTWEIRDTGRMGVQVPDAGGAAAAPGGKRAARLPGRGGGGRPSAMAFVRAGRARCPCSSAP